MAEQSTKDHQLSGTLHPNHGELRGARKRARMQATQRRREQQEAEQKVLSTPPSSAEEAAARWDRFYTTKWNLFKDRHLLRTEFPELLGDASRADPKAHVPPLSPEKRQLQRDARCDLTLIEVGCGVGNGVFPLLRANDRLFAYAFDVSVQAVERLKQNEEYRTDRVCAFVADVCEDFVGRVETADFVMVLWTLSALGSERDRRKAVGNLAGVCKEGGLVFVRDYARGDMRMHRFGQAVQEGLYLRGDGTWAYFFEREELISLFEAHGFECITCEYVERDVQNRKEQLTMQRRWLQAKFRRLA